MTDWREELIETIALQIGTVKMAQFGDWVITPTEKMREQARAALEVAEPVIREQCAEDAAAVAKEHLTDAVARIVAAAIREGGND